VTKAGPRSWTVDYDKQHACGNYFMGQGECIAYSLGVSGDLMNVQTIGLSRGEADLLVHSIQV
jgi:hypothetical protein